MLFKRSKFSNEKRASTSMVNAIPEGQIKMRQIGQSKVLTRSIRLVVWLEISGRIPLARVLSPLETYGVQYPPGASKVNKSIN